MHRYAISHRRALPAHPAGPLAALEQQVAAWAEADVEWIQIREKDLEPGELEALTRRLAAQLRRGRPGGAQSRLLLNGLAPERAQACGADGVHLPGASTAKAVRAARQSTGCVSVSCHGLDDVAAAVDGGATLLVWAPVFGKVVESEPIQEGTGLAALQRACQAANGLPVFALGGITPENATACLDAGAAGVAGIRLFAGEQWRQLR